MPARRGPTRKLLIGLVAALVVALVGGTAGVNAWAEHSICASIEDEKLSDSGSSGSSSEGLDRGDIADLRHVADQLRNRARLLVFDTSLRKAVDGLADDVDNLADLLDSSATTDNGAMDGGFAELIMVAASVNGHARQAQRACGLPATGVFNQ
ncbi:hypothetical protein [Paractinoplanes ferrugineus]|uniref:hypothetical protein n=1 Tax=Paractinoplanes ferrugineus TaxID=113564 RepID=UPI0019447DB1|nr:hypothetical protein [Actinoplanes ferrugineus]